MPAHNALQITWFRYRLIVGCKNDVHALKFGTVGSSITANLQQFHAKLLCKLKAFLYGGINFYTHAPDSQGYALRFSLPVLVDPGYSSFQGIKWDREAQSLSQWHHGRGNANHAPYAIDQRTTRVAGVDRRIGL